MPLKDALKFVRDESGASDRVARELLRQMLRSGRIPLRGRMPHATVWREVFETSPDKDDTHDVELSEVSPRDWTSLEVRGPDVLVDGKVVCDAVCDAVNLNVALRVIRPGTRRPSVGKRGARPTKDWALYEKIADDLCKRTRNPPYTFHDLHLRTVTKMQEVEGVEESKIPEESTARKRLGRQYEKFFRLINP